jgi:cell filamentation protein, protein adenylyltransferase
MNHGLRRLREDFPLSLRLIREIHKILSSKGRDSERRPGEFRTSQNWISGARPGNAAFVPPPPNNVMDCMGALENFPHREQEDLQPLVKAALVHVQFETIHPLLGVRPKIDFLRAAPYARIYPYWAIRYGGRRLMMEPPR